MPELVAQHPDIDIRVNAQGPHLQGDRLPWPSLADAPADVQIVYGDADLWDDRASFLFSEVFQPFCAPALLKQVKLESPDQLLQQTLISTSRNSVTWEAWLNSQDIDLYKNPVSTIQLDPSHLAIEAGVNGVGVILESCVLAGHDFSSGKLASPFPHLGRPGMSYWILTSPQRKTSSAVDAVSGWLRKKAGVERVN